MDKARPKTRDKILTAATKLFAEQGYIGTTVAQIAREAGVSEASIYEHFNGKEDVLLEIPVRGIREEFMPGIEDWLFGIKGAVNQLRKFIWEYIRALIKDTAYARVILLELKTNKSFTQTPAYDDVRHFFHPVVEIIRQGQENGELNPNMDPYHARMVILGAFEHMVIRWLLKDCAYDLFEQLEGVFEIIEHSLTAGRPLTSSEQPRPMSQPQPRN
jgi:TetR/AcrR family fatty acid metabolism transcriptional regulator